MSVLDVRTAMETTMLTRYLGALAIAASILGCGTATALFVQPPSNSGEQAKKCYPPEYTSSGDFILPKNLHEWVFVGSPFTPNALNGGQANFPFAQRCDQ
jgi:hypothetical protein